jgi:hypothetical protein
MRTQQIKVWSRDYSNATSYEYTGSFSVSPEQWETALAGDVLILNSWHLKMDCMYHAMFINKETNEVIAHNL